MKSKPNTSKTWITVSELFCYMNDNCVSANFKKDPENRGIDYICELNNATHLEYDTDLITNADFYYRGSKVKYKV